jgi:AraC family transcriptional regulator of arabinose operon
MIYPVITEKTRLLPVYVTGVSGDELHAAKTTRHTGYVWHQIAFCTEGAGVFCDSTGDYVIEEGTGFYFSPYVPHSYYATKNPWNVRWVTFDGKGFDDIARYASISKTEVYKIENPDRFNALVDKIYTVLSERGIYSDFDASSHLYNLIKLMVYCVDTGHKGNNKARKHASLIAVVDYMMKNYMDDISLESLAALMNVTPNYLCRRFKQVYGETVFSYLKQIRINTAARMLLYSPDLTVGDIALSVGFKDVSYFCKAFKNQTFFSPAEFRKMSVSRE